MTVAHFPKPLTFSGLLATWSIDKLNRLVILHLMDGRSLLGLLVKRKLFIIYLRCFPSLLFYVYLILYLVLLCFESGNLT